MQSGVAFAEAAGRGQSSSSTRGFGMRRRMRPGATTSFWNITPASTRQSSMEPPGSFSTCNGQLTSPNLPQRRRSPASGFWEDHNSLHSHAQPDSLAHQAASCGSHRNHYRCSILNAHAAPSRPRECLLPLSALHQEPAPAGAEQQLDYALRLTRAKPFGMHHHRPLSVNVNVRDTMKVKWHHACP
jgi:hypothetical protein